jgi:hypothetical protein
VGGARCGPACWQVLERMFIGQLTHSVIMERGLQVLRRSLRTCCSRQALQQAQVAFCKALSSSPVVLSGGPALGRALSAILVAKSAHSLQ